MPESRPKKQYLRGMKAGIPVMLGFIPVGIAYAIIARQAGFSIAQTCGMSVFVFAGASQIMAAGMYAQGAGLTAIIIATFILNFRHLIMSVCVMNRLKNTGKGKKLLAAFGVTDESFAIFTTERQENVSSAYLFGLITVTYLSWVAGSFIGAVSLDFLPGLLTASLGIALYAMFIALLMPKLSHSRGLAALVLLTALCNTVLNRFTEPSQAMIISTLLCAFIGVFFVDSEEKEKREDGRK